MRTRLISSTKFPARVPRAVFIGSFASSRNIHSTKDFGKHKSNMLSMKAILYEEYGDASKLKVVDHAKPVIQDNEVLVKVRAAGINPVDWKIRAGYMRQVSPQKLPIIPGCDVAGEVEAIGAAVTKFKVGVAVYSYNRPAGDMEEGKGEQIEENGCCAQYVAVKEFKLAAKPANISYDEAAAVPLAGLTAWQSLFDAGKLTAGQTVIVLGAAGGVGSFAVQFAKAHGATVIGTGSTKNIDFIKSFKGHFWKLQFSLLTVLVGCHCSCQRWRSYCEHCKLGNRQTRSGSW
jgi:NADPH:quinone reductase-like Zn-dependent oxidoreductase